MSFKFKLGEIILPSREAPASVNVPVAPSEVIAIQLNGYIRVQVVGTHQQILVRAEDYEICEDETIVAMG